MRNKVALYFLFLLNSITHASPPFAQPPRDATENWGTLENNLIFRSKKLNSSQLQERVTQHKIKSILCLAECTDLEKKISRELGLRYFDLSMNIPEIELDDLHHVVKVLKKAPKPLLIHCRQGADRTGMAAALYFYSIKNQSMDVSIKKGLRLRYGHLGKFWTPRIYEVLREYEKEKPQE